MLCDLFFRIDKLFTEIFKKCVQLYLVSEFMLENSDSHPVNSKIFIHSTI